MISMPASLPHQTGHLIGDGQTVPVIDQNLGKMSLRIALLIGKIKSDNQGNDILFAHLGGLVG